MGKRFRKFWRGQVRRWWYDYEWPLIGLVALGVVVLGYLGFHQHFLEKNQSTHPVDLLFKSLQLFVLQISVDPPMPLDLEIARVLAPLVAAYTAVQALMEMFAGQIRSFRLRFWHGHVILCGLGRKGLILARGFLERGHRVVVIEPDAENDRVEPCRDLGGVVLIGDATEPWLLRKAGVVHAQYLFALCGDDGVNAEVAVHAAQLLEHRKGPPLLCLAHIFNPQLCLLLRERELDTGSNGRLRLEFFNIYDLGARVLLEENPIIANVPGGTDCQHLVIVGVGRLGESLLFITARQWHAKHAGTASRLQVTLIDRNAQEIVRILMLRYPVLKHCCELATVEMDVHSSAFQKAEFLDRAGLDRRRAQVFVCLDDDSLSLATALALGRHARDYNPTVVVRLAQDAGLAVLLKAGDAGSGRFHHLRGFGLLDRTCQPDQVLRGTHEILARAIHEGYLRQQYAAGMKPEQNSSLVPWDRLPEHLKESNRQQADDIGLKLKAVHWFPWAHGIIRNRTQLRGFDSRCNYFRDATA